MLTLELPDELNDDLREILGRPNFACMTVAHVLRADGHNIDTKAEAEQAAVLFWALQHYARDPANWRVNANAKLRELRDKYLPQQQG